MAWHCCEPVSRFAELQSVLGVVCEAAMLVWVGQGGNPVIHTWRPVILASFSDHGDLGHLPWHSPVLEFSAPSPVTMGQNVTVPLILLPTLPPVSIIHQWTNLGRLI